MWIGCCTPQAKTGLKLKDNGICLIDEEKFILSISEERLSRTKHDNNLNNSLKLIQNEIPSLMAIGLTSCSDSPWQEKSIPAQFNNVKKVYLPSHHLSHAYSTFHLSKFSSSLIFVADAGGNTFSSAPVKNWWETYREQTSIFYGDGKDIYLLKRLHFAPFEIGYGEFYRAITHYLGWKSHTLSGNTMALSSFGFPDEISQYPIWEILNSSNKIKNDPQNPIKMIKQFLNYIGIKHIDPVLNTNQLTQDHKNLAAYLQRSIERSITDLIEDSVKAFGEKNICFSGGVAQNCVLNAKLAHNFSFKNVNISPFAGDVGQCVGNALFVRQLSSSQLPRLTLDSLYLGNEYSEKEIKNSLSYFKLDLSYLEVEELSLVVAQLLSERKVVGIFRGRSEFGPRALGNRSVLGDPSDLETTQRIKNAVKRRDEFMPLAPVISLDLAEELKNQIPLSNSMIFAPIIPEKNRIEFGYSLHVDNTARIQVPDNNPFLSSILNKFKSITNRRVLINTSFNKRGQPIVESPTDAITAFNELDIDALVLGNYILYK